MNFKEEKTETQTKQSRNNGIIILNEENIKPIAEGTSVLKSVALSPPNQITLSMAKPKSEKKLSQKKMDHYVVQTIKGEKNAEGEEEGESINFILTENNEDEEITEPSGEIVEEMQFSDGDEQPDEDEPTEIVEHVCGKCYKTFRRLKVCKLLNFLDFKKTTVDYKC